MWLTFLNQMAQKNLLVSRSII
jgi:hypothetical protein